VHECVNTILGAREPAGDEVAESVLVPKKWQVIAVVAFKEARVEPQSNRSAIGVMHGNLRDMP
jgi:hypothetical protein